ncbi:xylulokinase [Marmoricola sp. URHA0025 HA25]
MPLVAGIDTSTQSCKVLVVDADTGDVVRQGRASHPDGTEVDPAAWLTALGQATEAAGGLDDVAAIAVGGQQHGMVCLDDDGVVVRPALLWNDNRSAGAARDLIEELGGAQAWAEQIGVVPVASVTVTKLRWLAENEPENARRTSAVCLPHDWLTWQLAGAGSLDALVTDRGDASGTGYWSTVTGDYRTDLLTRALGSEALLPTVLKPHDVAGAAATPGEAVLGPGTGDNAASALGLGAVPGDVIVSIGTSGVACAVSEVPARDASGIVAGFADATGRFLPLVATLNGARVLDAAGRILGVDHDGLSRLALSAPAGAGGLVVVPYLEGERTPVKPDSTAAIHGLTLGTADPAHLARAAVEGLLCSLADCIDALAAQGSDVRRILLTGGGAASAAVRAIAPAVLGHPVHVPVPFEYVARGAARQAAWVLSREADPPDWELPTAEVNEAEPTPEVRARYAEARDLTLARPDGP